MALLENVTNLPKPVLYAGGAGAALGLLALMVRKSRESQGTQREQVAQSNTPVYLPPGSGQSPQDNQGNIDAVGAMMQSMLQNMTASQQALWDSMAASNQANQQAIIAAIAGITGQQQTWQPGNAPPQGGGTPWTGSNGGETPGGTAPAQNTPASPPQSPVPVNNNPIVPAPAGNTPAMTPGDTRTIADLVAGVGDINKESGGNIADKIVSWLYGSGYKPFSQYVNGQWQSYGRMEAGWVDQNTGMIMPVAYNGTHDYGVGDYTNESFAARWQRSAIDIMRNNPGVSQREAGLAALAKIKRDMDATGRNYYDSGFDMAGVPDNYGRGTYWQ